MPRIKIGTSNSALDEGQSWEQTIIRRIKQGKAVPLISNTIGYDLLFGSYDELVKSYATYIKYPVAEDQLPDLAQFKNVTDPTMTDAGVIKANFLDFIKSKLFDQAEAEGASKLLLNQLDDEFDDLTFSEFATRLDYPKFDRPEDNPLRTLAEFPLPIYLTTSYHDFLTVALKQAGKNPRQEICHWHDGLKTLPSVFDEPYTPTDAEPLVYHLHGLDTHPESLVLTKNDHYEFLVATTRHQGQAPDPIPKRVRQAMNDSSLMLLGYTLNSEDFDVVFWSLIKYRSYTGNAGVSIQLEAHDLVRSYLQGYMQKEANFEVYWGRVEEYIQELYQAYIS